MIRADGRRFTAVLNGQRAGFLDRPGTRIADVRSGGVEGERRAMSGI